MIAQVFLAISPCHGDSDKSTSKKIDADKTEELSHSNMGEKIKTPAPESRSSLIIWKRIKTQKYLPLG
jgi:hypothetical protein